MVPRQHTPVLGQFLVHVNGFIKARNASSLADYIALEPPFGKQYLDLIGELRTNFPAGQEHALEEKCGAALPAAREGDDGAAWYAFVPFMAKYLGYLRDVSADPSQYLRTYELLSELQQRANSALGHDTLGHLMLAIVITNARCVCRLAVGLDREPELIAHLSGAMSGGDDGGTRETLPERAANILRTAFVTCLNDRRSGLDANGVPEGKKKGIYVIANLCLKILFQCRQTRNAVQIFENLYNLSPPLSAYPKAQRVTYLYYLGRFYFQNSQFWRAQVVLQRAHDEAPTRPDCVGQRRQILVYLLTSNIILGRFPSAALLARPEAAGLGDRFLPICQAIRRGDLTTFRAHLNIDAPHAAWFLHFRILLQLRDRGEVLLWRSLVRKTWLLNGTRPAPDSRVAPQVDLTDLVAVFGHFDPSSTTSDTDADYADIGHIVNEHETPTDDQKASAVESKLSSLIDQGLVGGYIAHARGKFAILGTKAKGGDILAAGFPVPWKVFSERADHSAGDEDDVEEIPGWKRSGGVSGNPFEGGNIVRLSGARPAGGL